MSEGRSNKSFNCDALGEMEGFPKGFSAEQRTRSFANFLGKYAKEGSHSDELCSRPQVLQMQRYTRVNHPAFFDALHQACADS